MMGIKKDRNTLYITHSGELLLWLVVVFFIVAVSTIIYLNGVKKANDYTIFMQDVDGLIVGSPVRMMGIEVGHVIKLEPTNEEVYVKKWIEEYNYDFDIIEEGLKRSTSTTNPSIKYIDAIITSWYKKGFNTVDEILESEKPKSTAEKKPETRKTASDSKKKSFQSYSQREYDSSDDFYDDI